ncbi:RecX family transcriptional regulator [Paenibacillus cremeus]|uniref:RecX family transcriptional regulator n=1 Tax=Paenibacillus cremeus TaxID=2163881 RepID=UPI0021BD491C|nr:RecX family transcriptional regulator [Paenibacillus cremeus]
MTEQWQDQKGMITKVERQQRLKHRYNIFIDECFAFSVHEDILIRHRLFKGEYLEETQLQQILYAEEVQKAYVDALRLLSSRLRSEQEMRARLKQKGFSPEIIKVTLERLDREHYLDDTLFAEQLTKQRLESQKKGRHWIKQELQQRGINKETIHSTMEQVNEETEFRMAYALAEKRYAGELRKDASKARRKIAAFLARRGYPGGIVSRVLSQLPAESDTEEDWDELEMLVED